MNATQSKYLRDLVTQKRREFERKYCYIDSTMPPDVQAAHDLVEAWRKQESINNQERSTRNKAAIDARFRELELQILFGATSGFDALFKELDAWTPPAPVVPELEPEPELPPAARPRVRNKRGAGDASV
jgi:hypothetical protein